MKKTCTVCKKVKSISDYYLNKNLSDGHFNECKSCTKKRVITRYYDPKKRKEIIEYERKREQDPRRKAMKLQYQRNFRKNRPGVNRARVLVMRAVKQGRLVKEPCEKCGSLKVEAHHEDYRSPLKVMWLCRKHHMEQENKIPFE